MKKIYYNKNKKMKSWCIIEYIFKKYIFGIYVLEIRILNLTFVTS